MAKLRTLQVTGQASAATGPTNPTDLSRLQDVQALAGNAVVPAASNSAGIAGQKAADSNFVYLCPTTNTWVRMPAAKTWSAATVPAAGQIIFLTANPSGGWQEKVLAITANSLLSFDGSMVPQCTATSADIQTLLAAANFAAARTSLGIGTAGLRSNDIGWNFQAGGGNPSPGAFTTDNDTFPGVVSWIKFSSSTASGKTIKGILSIFLKGSAILLFNAAGEPAPYFITGRTVGSTWVQYNVTPQNPPSTAFSGLYTATFLPAAGGALQPDDGGTGASSYADGQILIGNSSTSGLNVATLTQGTNIAVTNGNGTITIGLSASANVLTFMGAANFAAMRTTLNLTVGTDVQAWNGTLDALAGKSLSGTGNIVLQSALDAVSAGIQFKASVRVATTANGTLASAFANGQTVDGIALATGNRILIKNQSAPAENGIYTVNASGAPTRATDFNVWTEIPGSLVAVQVGTANADTLWLSTADPGGTLGTTAITFTNWLALALLASNNLSDLANAATARTNLGLGTIATHGAGEYQTTLVFGPGIRNAGGTLSVNGYSANGYITPTDTSLTPTDGNYTYTFTVAGSAAGNGVRIALVTTGRAAGDRVRLNASFAADASRLRIYNATTSGTLLVDQTNDSTARKMNADFTFNGASWEVTGGGYYA